MFNPDDAQDKPQIDIFKESADNLHLDYRVTRSAKLVISTLPS